MSSLLLDTLRKAELDQYYSSFTAKGIIQLEALAQLSMQDYSGLGITSIPDRKKLFQLVQSLRQEIPTLENGLVSSPKSTTRYSATTSSSNKSSPPVSNMAVPSVTNDMNNLTINNNNGGRRGSSHNNQHQLPQIPTRSRSRTLPSSDSYHRPDFIKSNSNNNFFSSSHAQAMVESPPSDSEEENSDDSDKCEIRRGSGPLLDPYGVPIQNKARYKSATLPPPNHLFLPSSVPNPSPLAQQQQQQQLLVGQSDLNQKIRVCVRKRPLNKKELERSEKDIAPTAGVRSINVNEPKMKVDLTKYIEQHGFTFDDVFDSDETNEKIYQRTAQPLVKYVFDGGKATCFAYGQTGSGKTYTMLDPQLGLYVLAARDVFSLIRSPQYEHLSAWIGFYEIYQGQLYDLLNSRKKLFAREDGKQNVVIVGLKEFVIKNVEDLMQVFEYGSQARSTGSTGANSDSSRSHAVLQILLRPTKNRKKIIGKLSFIDLAGSERGADRGDTDVKTRMEGAEINKSLLALKECIRALDQDKRHTPFRQSKLTQVLKDSFVGNSRTCMIATISPNQSNSEHTLNTLRYADRVKELKGERDNRRATLSDTNTLDDPTSNNNNNNLMHQRQLSSSEEYTNEDDYVDDFHEEESDDNDLYNDVEEDDLLLHDEDFPSDGDVNILDEDFPHENSHQSRYEQQQQQHLLMQQQQQQQMQLLQEQQMLQQLQQQEQQLLQQHRRSIDPPPSANNRMMIPEGQQKYTRHPLDMPMSSSPNDYPSLQQQQQSFLSEEPSSSSINNNNHDFAPSATTGPTTTTAAQLEDCLFFDPNTIESFIKFHRAQIREVTEFSKKETKLLANFSLALSSRNEEGTPVSLREELKTSSEFIGYLDNLDEVLEMKTAAIEALRDRIRHVLGEEEL